MRKVHYDFILDEVDANNLYSLLRESAGYNHEAIQELLIKADNTIGIVRDMFEAQIEFRKERSVYIEWLIKQMKHSLVEEPDDLP